MFGGVGVGVGLGGGYESDYKFDQLCLSFGERMACLLICNVALLRFSAPSNQQPDHLSLRVMKISSSARGAIKSVIYMSAN